MAVTGRYIDHTISNTFLTLITHLITETFK